MKNQKTSKERADYILDQLLGKANAASYAAIQHPSSTLNGVTDARLAELTLEEARLESIPDHEPTLDGRRITEWRSGTDNSFSSDPETMTFVEELER